MFSTERITISVPKDTRKALEILAKRRGIHLATLIKEMISEEMQIEYAVLQSGKVMVTDGNGNIISVRELPKQQIEGAIIQLIGE